ncbi:MAG: PH domain-containing protein, partial [Minisyncoccia bacterium]
HKIVLLSYFLTLLMMSLLPIVFYIIAVPLAFPAFFYYPYDRMYIFFSLIYYGFLWISVFIKWVDYYLDVWIVTDMRLLDIEQVGFFSRKVSEVDLKRIQDITSEVTGMMESMFGFGNVFIQTASEETRFKLKSIPHPVTTRKIIIDLYEAAREKDRFIFKERDE